LRSVWTIAVVAGIFCKESSVKAYSVEEGFTGAHV